MANKIFPGQFDDEEVLVVFKRHPIVMRKGLIIMMITILIGAFVGMFMSRNGGIALFYYWIGWHYSVCIVTNQRFLQIKQTGIFKNRSVNDINLTRILSVNYEIKGMLQTMLGFGTIIIQTLVGDFFISNVSKPARTQASIVSAIKKSGVKLSEETSDVE